MFVCYSFVVYSSLAELSFLVVLYKDPRCCWSAAWWWAPSSGPGRRSPRQCPGSQGSTEGSYHRCLIHCLIHWYGLMHWYAYHRCLIHWYGPPTLSFLFRCIRDGRTKTPSSNQRKEPSWRSPREGIGRLRDFPLQGFPFLRDFSS